MIKFLKKKKKNRISQIEGSEKGKKEKVGGEESILKCACRRLSRAYVTRLFDTCQTSHAITSVHGMLGITALPAVRKAQHEDVPMIIIILIIFKKEKK